MPALACLRHSRLTSNGFHRSHISMGVRLNSSDGLILYAGGEKGDATVALSVSEGRLQLHFLGGKRKISMTSSKKYNDGLWHEVSQLSIALWGGGGSNLVCKRVKLRA